MRTVHTGPVVGLIVQSALLAGLAATVGLNIPGAVVGLTFGVVTALALWRGLIRAGAAAMGAANWVTSMRAALVGGVAALVTDSFLRPIPVSVLIGMSAVALVLDAVDGRVARRTGSASPLGARFDMEVDAFLILVLSIYAAPRVGTWVLAIGAARYVFAAAAEVEPWLRGSLPPRYWRKVVAAIQGVVLAVAAAGILPLAVTEVALAVSLALLAESFGRDVWWLWRHRAEQLEPATIGTAEGGRAEGAVAESVRRGGPHTAAAWIVTVLAFLLVWFVLTAPNDIHQFSPAVFLRLPLEALVVVAVVLVLPSLAGRVTATVVGVVLGVLTLLKVVDMGFFEALDRPFNPITDWSYLGPAVGVLIDSIGRPAAIAALVVAGGLALAVIVLLPLAVLRLTKMMARRRRASMRFVSVFAVVWILCATFGVQVAQGARIASTTAAGLAYEQVSQISAGLEDQQTFAGTIAHDPLSITPAADLLTALRGKDVIIAFIESYGRVAVQDSAFSPAVDAVLDAGTQRLRDAGFDARSAFLTSPTFGGISWLAHSTLQSGVWVNSQQRYNELVAGDRFTLSDAFGRAGWRTVGDVPSNERSWPEGTSFYHYDQIYDEHNVGYQGPSFSYASMPDQYILSAFQRKELAPAHRAPVMAEIDLVSSHTPWAPLPQLVSWSGVGDGSVFDSMPALGRQPAQVWSSQAGVQEAYGQSVQYSINTLVSFVQTYGDKNLVLVVLGDHQPATVVSGPAASHDVPISIIAHDPAVFDRIAGWGWQTGLRPHPQAPVWPMDSFRNRFLTAFGR